MNFTTDYTHAGGIVFRKRKGTFLYLIVTAKGNPDDWIIPKGHIEPGETPEQTAVREVSEETGVQGKVIQPVGDSQFQTTSKTVRVLFFLMEYSKETQKKENRKQRWCTYEEGRNLLTFQDTKRLLSLAHDALRK
jgi:8-oxo-dGTP pyrophosphatase MutT (NUDIX family)